MNVSETQVKHLRDENAKLKKLVAELNLDKDILQSVSEKIPWAPNPATMICRWGPRFGD
jgi:hypothetical protein